MTSADDPLAQGPHHDGLVSILVVLDDLRGLLVDACQPLLAYAFQSLLSWMTSADPLLRLRARRQVPVSILVVLDDLRGRPTCPGPAPRRAGFNPCCLG